MNINQLLMLKRFFDDEINATRKGEYNSSETLIDARLTDLILLRKMIGHNFNVDVINGKLLTTKEEK